MAKGNNNNKTGEFVHRTELSRCADVMRRPTLDRSPSFFAVPEATLAGIPEQRTKNES